jgi:hypothetical protein
MILTSSNLAHYLMVRGLVTAQSVVEGDYLAVEVMRRNRNFKVIRQRHPGYFVKQVKVWDAASLATLRSEAQCYRLASSHPSFRTLQSLVPAFYAYDEANAILVTELLGNSENFSEYHTRQGVFPLPASSELGSAFGRYHRKVPVSPPEEPGSASFQRRIPWPLTLYRHEWKSGVGMSQANLQMVELVHRYPEFARALQPLCDGWSATALIHGDIKWDNCMLQTGADGKAAIRIVDWEMADWGDGLWDVAAILNQYLSHWIYSMPTGSSADAADLVESASHPFHSMLPAIHVFWHAYVQASGLSGAAAEAALTKVMAYCGARMLQSVYEYSQYSAQLTRPALFLLQASQNILSDPPGAIRDLLGMGAAA